MSMLVNPFLFGAGGGVDPDFASVVLLCNFDGVDAATTSTDESNSAHTLTFNSNAQLDDAWSQFAATSLRLALTDDTVTIPDHADWHFGLAEDFTIEMFVRWNDVTASAGNQVLISQYNNVGNQRSWYLRLTGGTALTFFGSGNGSTTGFSIAGAFTPVDNTPYYIAVKRESTTITIVAAETGPTSTIVADTALVNDDALHDSTQALMIGAFNSSGIVQEFDGWIGPLRITKGVARDISTVPIVAFPNS